jgi:DNA-binding MarR family transcriptional regulator
MPDRNLQPEPGIAAEDRTLRPAGLSRSENPALGEMIQLLSQCHRRLRHMLAEQLRRWELGDNEFLVLWLCNRASEHGVAQGELAEALGISAAHMSGLVERLRCRTLLTGRRCRLDRRRQLWFVDTPGQRLLEKIGREIDQLANALERCLPLPQQQLLVSLLGNLAEVGAAGVTWHRFDPRGESNWCGREARDARSRQ